MTRMTLRGRLGILVTMTALVVASAPSARAGEHPARETPEASEPSEASQAPPPESNEIPPAPLPPRKRKRDVGAMGRLHAGVGQRSFFSNSALGTDLMASLGMYVDNVNMYLDLQMLFASSEGLPVRQFRFGPSLDFDPFSRVRLGLGLSVGGTTITRETSGKTMSAFSLGARVLGTVDVWRFTEGEHSAVYVLGQLSIDSAGTFLGSDHRQKVPATALWGPSLALGVRF